MNTVLLKAMRANETRAVAMTNLKISEDKSKLTLYAVEDESFESSVELPSYNDATCYTTKMPCSTVYNVDEYITEEDKANSTAIIQELIDMCYENGGGTLWFGSNIYYVTGLVLKSKVYLKGNGIGSTILYRLINQNIPDASISDDYHSGHAFISIPVNSSGCGVSNMSIYGDCSLSTLDSNQMAGSATYNENSIVNGIMYYNAPLVATDSNGNGVNGYEVHYNSNITNLTPYKFSTLENISIIGFSGSGIIIGVNCENITLNNVSSHLNRYEGIINAGKHVISSNIMVNGNGGNGIYDLGSSNLYDNVSSMYNGKYDHKSTYGISIIGDYCKMNNIFSGSNYATGIYVEGTYNNITNIHADANGARSVLDSEGANDNPLDVPQVHLKGLYNSISGIITNSTARYIISKMPLLVDKYASNCTISIVTDNHSGFYNSYLSDDSPFPIDLMSSKLDHTNYYILYRRIIENDDGE